MPEFPNLAPPKSITDPKAAEHGADYPRHLHRYAPKQDGENYTSGEYLVVHSDEEKDAALADGWSLEPVLDDPDVPQDEKKARRRR